MTKCTAKKDGYALTFCEAMKSTIRPRSSKSQKGLLVSEITNIQTGDRVGSLVFLVTTERKNGIAFNVCPFCGGELIGNEKHNGGE